MTARPAAEIVRALWDRFEARDFDGAGELLADDVVVDWPVTGERISGRHDVVELNRAYPEPWGHIVVEEILADGGRVAARVRIDAPGATFMALGWYDVSDGRIERAVEHWVTLRSEEPPPERARWTERV